MPSTAPAPAELSSLASSLDDLGRRLRAMAEAAAPADGEDEDGVASDLWEIERVLKSAQRRLEHLIR
ncbi:MAG TPA: hypothetical protein VMY88_11105 [Acidimicrobiales bacterium]|nr:hypothetical protein [Acidimicrobiales bacterium]